MDTLIAQVSLSPRLQNALRVIISQHQLYEQQPCFHSVSLCIHLRRFEL